MAEIKHLKFHKVSSLPGTPEADAWYLVDQGGNEFKLYVTNNDGTIAYSALVDAAGAIPAGGTTGQALIKASDTNYDLGWGSVAGSGDVTAAAAFGTDNRLIRSDGTGKGVQASPVTVDDSGNASGFGTLATTDDAAIGTAPMTYRFRVDENQNGGTTFAVVNTDTGGSASAQFRLQSGNSYYFAFQNYSSGTAYMFTNTSFVFGTYASTNITILTNTTARAYFHNTGEFTLGTATKSALMSVNGAVRVGQYTVATLPSASGNGAGAIIYVSDETGGAITAFSDGTNWRRHSDRAIVS